MSKKESKKKKSKLRGKKLLVFLDPDGDITIPIGFSTKTKEPWNIYLPIRSREKN